jgi:ClpP class serine protease
MELLDDIIMIYASTDLTTFAVSPSAFGLTGRKTIAIVREAGSITGGSQPSGGQITAEPLIRTLKALARDRSIAGIVLRVDSPGLSLLYLEFVV